MNLMRLLANPPSKVKRPLTILVAHNHYQIPGGEDTVFQAECNLLEQAGHRIIRYEKQNHLIQTNSLFQKLQLFFRTLWNPTTTREVAEIIERERVDVVHCHNTFPLISPSIYWVCTQKKIPVIQTLHNYRFTCLNGYLYRKGQICHKCLGKWPLAGLKRRCYRDSLSASATLTAMLLFHRLIGTFRHQVTRYIALTEIGKSHFIQAGLPPHKIVVKPNFILDFPAPSSTQETSASGAPSSAPAPIFLYAGRLSDEKGPDIVLQAFLKLPPQSAVLEIAGSGPMLEELQALAKNASNPIRFLGHLSRADYATHLQAAAAVIIATRTYETFGLTLFEAHALGTPALVSDCVVTTSFLTHPHDGMTFQVNNPTDLAEKMRLFLAHPYRVSTPIPVACTPNGNRELLESIYESVLSDK